MLNYFTKQPGMIERNDIQCTCKNHNNQIHVINEHQWANTLFQIFAETVIFKKYFYLYLN